MKKHNKKELYLLGKQYENLLTMLLVFVSCTLNFIIYDSLKLLTRYLCIDTLTSR